MKKDKSTVTPESNVTLISITPPKMRVLAVKLIGTAPLVIHAFSEKNRKKMLARQEEGSKAKGKTTRDPRDINQDYEQAQYTSTQGWKGMPAGAFRSAMISACRVSGVKMTVAKLTVFVQQDGFDKATGKPLVRIHGEPEMHMESLRNDNGGADVRVRPMYRDWSIDLRVMYDADQMDGSSVVNLLSRAGMQVGVGEGRPDSRFCSGCGWGTWRLENESKGSN